MRKPRLTVLAIGALTLAPVAGAAVAPLGEPWLQSAKLASDPPAAGASLGSAVAASAGRVLLGAPGEGAAYVFEQGAGGWVQAARLSVPGLSGSARFGDAVALHGAAAFVGAPGAASVYVFHRGADGAWALAQTLAPGGPAAGTRFGASLSTDGTRLVVGAPHAATSAGDKAGAVHVFAGVGGTLAPEQVLTADLGAPALLGWSVAVLGDRAAAGATRAGAVAVFERAAGTWAWTGTVTSAASDDGFARAVALGAGVLAVGAPFEPDEGGVETGAVHLYEPAADGWWEHAARLLPQDLAPVAWRPWLGLSLAFAPDGTLLVAGAPGDDKAPGLPAPAPAQGDPLCTTVVPSPTCHGPGATYVFTRGTDGWAQEAKLTALDALPYEARQLGKAAALGSAVALDASTGLVVAGAPHADFLPGDEAGAAYRFQRLDAGVGL